MSEAPKSLGPDALLRQKVKQKRFRDGYEEGLSSTHRATSAAAFILSEQPVEMLGQYSRCPPVLFAFACLSITCHVYAFAFDCPSLDCHAFAFAFTCPSITCPVL